MNEGKISVAEADTPAELFQKVLNLVREWTIPRSRPRVDTNLVISPKTSVVLVRKATGDTLLTVEVIGSQSGHEEELPSILRIETWGRGGAVAIYYLPCCHRFPPDGEAVDPLKMLETVLMGLSKDFPIPGQEV